MIFSKRYFITYSLISLWALLTICNTTAQRSSRNNRNIVVNDSVKSDSLSFETDSATVKSKKSPLQDVVTYKAKDSLVYTGNNYAYLFGAGSVSYQEINLDADEIKMSLDSSSVYANGVPDSIGVLQGKPVFKDKSGEYNSNTIHYNFGSGKGFINNLVTQQGEGYLVGGQTKKMADNEFYMVNGKYTTCDYHDCPHFYLQLTKAKVKPKKNIVTGPAYLVLADVPLPIAIPFGYFPFTESYSSGILMPTYGDELTRGFYLRDGGYYFAISDYMDLAATGEIYTKGSWGFNLASNYAWRYKFSGNFNLGYQVTITGDKGLSDYVKMKNFKVTWSHSQDTKANPNMTLSASVNFSTSGYDRNNLDSYYNANKFTENTKSSTVNMTYNFPNLPLSVSTTANITQRSADSTLNVSFPDFTLNMTRIYPFKKKVTVGKEKWFEKISMSYTGLFRNSITASQDEFFQKNLIKDWKNGMQHTIPISSTFNVLKYINISPSVNFVDRMYTNKITRSWDPSIVNSNGETTGGIARDTTYGFYNVYNFSFSLSANTKLYGFYQPLPFLGKKVEMIRHVFTPSLSFSAQPDFSKSFFGAWETYQQPSSTDPLGYVDVFYSPFDHGQFGTAPRGKSGTLSFNMTHNIEAKVKSDRDTTGVKKISIIDNLSTGINYNFAADSMRWSDIPLSMRFKITKGFTLQLSGTLDSYTYDGNGRKIDQTRWSVGKLPRLKSTSTSFSYTFNNETFKKWFGGDDTKDKKKNDTQLPPTDEDTQGYESLESAIDKSASTEAESKSEFDKDGYMDWNIPWSLSVNYGVRLGYGSDFNAEKREFKRQITQNLSFSGNLQLTKNWSFNFSSSYDFDQKKISYMNCNVTRDLHCWTMSAGIVPVGPYASYNFSIRVKSSLLSDLKYDKRSSPSSKMDWY
ncbi:MAG: putative LPS assembly protein LptD [Bacteroidales bacterium]|nr:putative LPS assembly protein LptD [Bacteroidales bacterium]